MLRITTTVTDALQRWTLQGQLAGPWVEELETSWKQVRETEHPHKSIVDLTDVTFIDEAGARLLLAMKQAGVKFIAGGVDTKHLLDDLKRKNAPPLRRCLAWLTSSGMSCGAPAKTETEK